ncbi:hypothetical protein OAA09_00420 [bacterium]|nr:hypothetical protein [bacterium]
MASQRRSITNRSQFLPINAIEAKLVPGGELQLFYPMFSSHLMLPVKPGEYVWVLFPESSDSEKSDSPGSMMGENAERTIIDSSTDGGTKAGNLLRQSRASQAEGPVFKKALVIRVYGAWDESIDNNTLGPDFAPDDYGGYWLSRVPGTRLSEDVNLTIGDRDIDERLPAYYTDPTNPEILGDEEYQPLFPNGRTILGHKVDTKLDKQDLTIKTDPAQVARAYLDSSAITHEPVPILNKNPGDLVFQGSNNTAIVLGEGPVINEEYSSGGIDIVAGRGHGVNMPQTIENMFGVLEKDKVPELSGLSPNSGEGDMDYILDLSRIFVSSYCHVDSIFCAPTIAGASENLTFSTTAPSVNGRTVTLINEENEENPMSSLAIETAGPAAAIKSDHIRIVGRETIRFIVESPDGPGTAPEITMHKDGNIFIRPGKNGQLYLGGGPDDAPAGPGTAGFADMVTFPDDVTGGPAFVSEMAVAAKIPTRHSTQVKVKL